MKAQKRYYGFYSDDGHTHHEGKPHYGILYSYVNDDLIGKRLPYRKMNIEYGFGDYEETVFGYCQTQAYLEESLDKLSLPDAVKKGIKTIFQRL